MKNEEKNSVFAENFKNLDSAFSGEDWRSIGKNAQEKNEKEKDIIEKMSTIMRAFSTVAELNNSQSIVEENVTEQSNVSEKSCVETSGRTADFPHEKKKVIMTEPAPAARAQDNRNYDSSALQKKIDLLEHRFKYNYIYPSREPSMKQEKYIKRVHKIMHAKLPTYEDFIDFSSKYLSENPYFDERVYFIADLVYTKKNAICFIPLTNINLFYENQPWYIFYEFDNFIEAVKRL